MIPRQPLETDSIHHGGNHATHIRNGPQRAKDAHVAVLVALVRLLVTRGSPEELDAKEPVLDGRQVGVGLHNHDVLHVEAVLGFGPEPKNDGAVDDGRDGEGEVVVLEVLGAEGEEEGAGDGGDEDAEGDGGVVEETCMLLLLVTGVIGQWEIETREGSNVPQR